MIEEKLVENLRKKFEHVHPLIFHRSRERATSAGDLFDILDTLPKEFPIVWDEEERRWMHTEDIFLLKGLLKKDED